MYELRISIAGDKIEVAAIREALSDLLKLLKIVEQQVAGGEGVRWRLATLSYSSPVVIGCFGEPRSRKGNVQNRAELIGTTLVSGFADLEGGKRPPGFSDDALEVSRRLASLRGKRGVSDILVMEENGKLPAPFPLSAKTIATVEDFIGVKSESLGSVDGRLEVISARGGFTFTVYEALTGKAVRCEVPDHMKRTVLDAFEERVIATGIVKRDAAGQARQITLHTLEVIAPSQNEYVSLAGIAPDFTDGVESAKYIKDRWK